jgi:hypothetical protein
MKCFENKIGFIVLATVALSLSKIHSAEAAQIGASAFGPSATVESFEGLRAGANMAVYLPGNGYGYLIPGVAAPFTFASGVTLTNPIPNPGGRNGVLVGDFSIGGASFGLGSNGSINSSSDMPDGSAYIAIDGYSTAGPMEFTFSAPISRVGGFVTSTGGNITLSAYDIANVLLESVSISSVNATGWKNNFLGLQNSAGIAKITFNSDYLVLDKLTFESSATAVPTPALLPGLVGLGLGAWRKRKGTLANVEA